ncbi:Hypothetical protein ORPV_274 [Orpheovirus IHUMI-LCC2]|uniref:Uncharacterized protein n=1 Tax=Orpheovirus IHUMI-LCC2 TaxID=2023057 RepID=A0A2I2L3R8_9VIRU|nr:Hypothetical protein ORPV_274 [Orpheovirus IHUMI-LCC2]SNW62178.1 Hypothetical protein ORPV_274 [Orpheovirus IHUMI-LCC2]
MHNSINNDKDKFITSYIGSFTDNLHSKLSNLSMETLTNITSRFYPMSSLSDSLIFNDIYSTLPHFQYMLYRKYDKDIILKCIRDIKPYNLFIYDIFVLLIKYNRWDVAKEIDMVKKRYNSNYKSFISHVLNYYCYIIFLTYEHVVGKSMGSLLHSVIFRDLNFIVISTYASYINHGGSHFNLLISHNKIKNPMASYINFMNKFNIWNGTNISNFVWYSSSCNVDFLWKKYSISWIKTDDEKYWLNYIRISYILETGTPLPYSIMYSICKYAVQVLIGCRQYEEYNERIYKILDVLTDDGLICYTPNNLILIQNIIPHNIFINYLHRIKLDKNRINNILKCNSGVVYACIYYKFIWSIENNIDVSNLCLDYHDYNLNDVVYYDVLNIVLCGRKYVIPPQYFNTRYPTLHIFKE